MAKHTAGEQCPSCDERMLKAHPELKVWFSKVKAKFPDIHVSWVYRDEKSQEEAFKSGASKLRYPHSAHNKTPACALDMFQLNSSGNAIFDPIAMARIYNELGKHLIWGGNFKTLGDSGHFELPEAE